MHRVPRKIRQLIKDLENAGFEFSPGKGSHRKYRHPLTQDVVVISGGAGDDAQRYQERDVEQALKAVKKLKKP
jgi:predicted RNA binding protein YcfA (HicA-like mRNA interferase family)